MVDIKAVIKYRTQGCPEGGGNWVGLPRAHHGTKIEILL